MWDISEIHLIFGFSLVTVKCHVLHPHRKKPPVQYVRCEMEGCGTVLAHPRYLQVCLGNCTILLRVIYICHSKGVVTPVSFGTVVSKPGTSPPKDRFVVWKQQSHETKQEDRHHKEKVVSVLQLNPAAVCLRCESKQTCHHKILWLMCDFGVIWKVELWIN